MIIKLVVVEDPEEKGEDDCHRFLQTTDVSKPIQLVVGFTVESIQVQVELERNRCMHIVKVFVWSDCVWCDCENLTFSLGVLTKLNVFRVLKLQVSDSDLLSNFHPAIAV